MSPSPSTPCQFTCFYFAPNKTRAALHQPTVTKTVLDDDVGDDGHYKCNLVCIRGTCEVWIDTFRLRVLVQRNEFVEKELRGLVIVCAVTLLFSISTSPSFPPTCILGKILIQRGCWQFFLEQINLIEKKNDACLQEPLGVANAVENSQGFLHAVGGLILH